MPALDEKALRRDTFTPGVEVVLSDGQAWTFPLPVVGGFYPREGPDGSVDFIQSYDQGDDYDRLIDEYVDADPEDMFASMRTLARLAFCLLARNYAVTFADMRHLLRWEVGARAEAGGSMWREVAAVALGRAPKPTPVGDEPA